MTDQEGQDQDGQTREVIEAWLNSLVDRETLGGEELDKLLEFMSRAKTKGHLLAVDYLKDGKQYLIIDPKRHEVIAHMSARWGKTLLHLWDLAPLKDVPKGQGKK